MKRRKVVITIEAETVLTIGELKKLHRVLVPGRSSAVYLSTDPKQECSPTSCRGTITQVQVNVIK